MTDELDYLRLSQSVVTEWNPDGCLVPWTILFKDFRTLTTDPDTKSA